MTAKEIIEIVKESKLWESLTQKEKQEVIKYALACTQVSITEENMGTAIGEVYLSAEPYRVRSLFLQLAHGSWFSLCNNYLLNSTG